MTARLIEFAAMVAAVAAVVALAAQSDAFRGTMIWEFRYIVFAAAVALIFTAADRLARALVHRLCAPR